MIPDNDSMIQELKRIRSLLKAIINMAPDTELMKAMEEVLGRNKETDLEKKLDGMGLPKVIIINHKPGRTFVPYG